MVKTVSIPPAVADVLTRCTAGPDIITLPPGALDKALYAQVDKVLKAMGGKWNRSRGGHVFPDGFSAQLADVLAAGSVVDQKKTLEQFYTPADLVERMCNIVGNMLGVRVLEPSAGNGAIVRQLRACGAHVLAIEIDPRNVMTLVQEEAAVIGRVGSIHIEQGDFLTMPLQEMGWHHMPDAVVMNPPFSRNQDIAHVLRAFDVLAPRGVLVAVMSSHFTFANDAPSRHFRALLGMPVSEVWDEYDLGEGLDNRPGGLLSANVARLPANTFRASGTDVAAVLVTLRKSAA